MSRAGDGSTLRPHRPVADSARSAAAPQCAAGRFTVAMLKLMTIADVVALLHADMVAALTSRGPRRLFAQYHRRAPL